VKLSDTSIVLDREQLREVTLDDEDLMREIISALIDDTTQQVLLLESAIREEDGQKCMRLAHYSKGACANVGANAAAEALKQIEEKAAKREFQACSASLTALGQEIARLRLEV
jgi:HPt (histidine-containing phosphotransfer) domain-containing protein